MGVAPIDPIPVKDSPVTGCTLSNSKAVALGIGFVLLAVLEYAVWFFLAFDNPPLLFGNRNLNLKSAVNVLQTLPGLALLFGPLVNLLFAIFFFLRKKSLYVAATVYGLVSSVVILVCQIFAVIIEPLRLRYLLVWNEAFGGCARVLIVDCLAILMFAFLLTLFRAKKMVFFILSAILAAAHSIAFVLLNTHLVFNSNMQVYDVSLILRSFKVRGLSVIIPDILSIIVTVLGIVMYCLLTCAKYKCRPQEQSQMQ